MKIPGSYSTTIHLRCTLAWCSSRPNKIDRGASARIDVEMTDLLPEGEVDHLQESLLLALDHKPIDAAHLTGTDQAFQFITGQIREICGSEFVQRVNITVDRSFTYSWSNTQ